MNAKFGPSFVLVVAVLSGIIGGMVGSQHTKIIDTISRRDLLCNSIATALEYYRVDHGSYPTTEQGLSVLLGTNGGQAYLTAGLNDPHGWPVQYFLVNGRPLVGFFAAEVPPQTK
jgi:hypothetical protein